MAWLVICRDIDDSEALRQRHLERHLAYVDTILDQIAIAGPLASQPQGVHAGSCFIYHTDDRTVAESLLFNDPYYQAGLYVETQFQALRPAAGTWVGAQPGAEA